MYRITNLSSGTLTLSFSRYVSAETSGGLPITGSALIIKRKGEYIDLKDDDYQISYNDYLKRLIEGGTISSNYITDEYVSTKQEVEAIDAESCPPVKTPVADITTLKDVDTTDANEFPCGTFINVTANGTYKFQRPSTATESLPDIVKPTTGPGRWYIFSTAVNDHNSLSGIQGGTTDEYYHLTQAQHSALVAEATTIRITNTDSPYTVPSNVSVVIANTDGGAITVNYTAGTQGRHIKVANAGSSGNNVTLNPNGSEKIWGEDSYTLIDSNILDAHFDTTEGWW